MATTPPPSPSSGGSSFRDILADLYERERIERQLLENIKAQSEYLKDYKTTQREIRRVAKELNDLAYETKTLNDDYLGTEQDVAKLQKILRNGMSDLKRLRKEEVFLSQQNNRNNSALIESLKEQLRLSTEHLKIIRDQEELSRKIKNNFGTIAFPGLSKLLGKFPGLSKISKNLDNMGEASRLSVATDYKQNKIVQERLDKLQKIASGSTPATLENMAGLNLKGRSGRPLTGAAAQSAARAALASGNTSNIVGGKILSGTQIGLRGLQSGFKALGPIIKGALGPLSIIMVLADVIKFFIDAMFKADVQVTKMAKSFNITKESARSARENFFKLANEAGRFTKIQKGNLLLQEDLVEANLKINSILGTSVNLSENLGEKGKTIVSQFANASKFLGLSEEEQKGLLSLTAITGKEIDKIKFGALGTAKAFKMQTGILIDERRVLTQVLTASNYIKLSIKGGAEALYQSAINAELLGIKIADLEKTTSAVLNFESSIKDELAAELLLGRNINLDKLRFASLTNDTKTVSEEVLKLVNQYGDSLQNNTLVSGAFAKTLGVSKQEFADMVAKGKELNMVKTKFNSLGKDTLENLKTQKLIDEGTYNRLKNNTASSNEFYNALKQSIAMSGKYSDVQAKLNEILGETSATSLEAQDMQAKFNDAIKRLQEAFTRFVDGGFLDRMIDGLVGFADFFVSGDLQADYQAAKITTSKTQTSAPKTSISSTAVETALAFTGPAGIAAYTTLNVMRSMDKKLDNLDKPSIAYISTTEANKAITNAPTQASKQTARA